MKKTAASATGRTALAGLAGLLCAVLAACGTVRAGEAAGPAPAAAPSPEICDLDGPTDGGPGAGTATPDIPTDQETGAYAGPPTDQETGAYAGPPTDQETGAYAGPPTDQETGTYAGPPTDQDTGPPDPPTDQDTGTPDPPTDQDTGTPDPPTDGTAAPGGSGGVTNGAGPCGAIGWFDMTRDFAGWYAKHRTEEDQGIPADGIGPVRVRKVGGAGRAEVTFTTEGVGKSRGDDARRVVRVFADWRHEVYGDTGTVTVHTRETSPVTVAGSW
ncbi:hypothetical protein J7F03_17580 [Streptomyces sp. ISL-43]|uniref:hypothetical protein n=1 Tax=Streptomyces sp. ISL-43 TaxID=2819183 RepID=UPI001BE5208C|nr:hypothetical protein [Streptomyces sp. ISL-43]MBT2448869.1 hypothetical protein [Streptomyces sp. ISL-43]